jgi:hypothetical protein
MFKKNLKKNYNMKKTISMKKFIAELGENFSDHMKKRLLELEVRCVLTRKEENNILDIKHVEHIQHDNKEYVFGQFIVVDGVLYFSENHMENSEVMPSPVVSTIYNSLNTESTIFEDGNTGKIVDDSNIDYILDEILSVCPPVSQSYLDIMSKYM